MSSFFLQSPPMHGSLRKRLTHVQGPITQMSGSRARFATQPLGARARPLQALAFILQAASAKPPQRSPTQSTTTDIYLELYIFKVYDSYLRSRYAIHLRPKEKCSQPRKARNRFRGSKATLERPHFYVDHSNRNGEERWMGIARLQGSCWTVIYTKRDYAIRIISVRRSLPKEVSCYDKAFARNDGRRI